MKIRGDESKPCSICGEQFYRDKRCTWAQWGRAKCCSPKCAGVITSRRFDAIRKPIDETFQKWFEKSDGCWEWCGALDKDGYGVFSYRAKITKAHVMALLLDGRSVPKGMYGCHTCDNPSCVNPAHLYVGTPAMNSKDMTNRGRQRLGESLSHSKLTNDNVRFIRKSKDSASVLATAFGVSRTCIHAVRARKTWRHI